MLSYAFVVVYWSNHHYLLQSAKRADHMVPNSGVILLATIAYLLLQLAIRAQAPAEANVAFPTRDWFSGTAFVASITAAYLFAWLSFAMTLAGVSFTCFL